jgi:hypothetical protein
LRSAERAGVAVESSVSTVSGIADTRDLEHRSNSTMLHAMAADFFLVGSATVAEI